MAPHNQHKDLIYRVLYKSLETTTQGFPDKANEIMSGIDLLTEISYTIWDIMRNKKYHNEET